MSTGTLERPPPTTSTMTDTSAAAMRQNEDGAGGGRCGADGTGDVKTDGNGSNDA